MTANRYKTATALVDQSGSFERSQSKMELNRLKAPLELKQIRLRSRLLSLIQQQLEIASALDIVAKMSDEVLRAADTPDVHNRTSSASSITEHEQTFEWYAGTDLSECST